MKQRQMMAHAAMSVQNGEVVERIKAGMNKEFKPVAQTVYQARQVEIIVSGKPMDVRISGLPEIVKGKDVICRNTENQATIDVTLGQAPDLLQNSADKGIFFLGSGEIKMVGEREFKPLKDLNEKQPQTVRILPRSDPDEVIIDGKVFKQTGAVCVRGENMFILL